MNNRRNGGFTLVELLVTIAVGSLITLAATTVLLLGLRINRQASDTMDRQYTVRIMMSVMEDMATEGTITGLESDEDSWVLYGEGEKKIFTYETATRAITAGNGTVLMENVIGSIVSLNDNGILTIGIETADGSYTSSVYCRRLQPEQVVQPEAPTDEEVKELNTTEARAAFLKVLVSQYRMANGSVNPGLVLNSSGQSTGWYYSEWYALEQGKYGWDKDTPWCACFISWGLWHMDREKLIQNPNGKYDEVRDQYLWFASVDYFMDYLKKEKEEKHAWQNPKNGEGENFIPQPGDLIFFDWTGKGVDPAHVGVVFKYDAQTREVYTIEGNYSDSVAIRKYPLEAKEIMGYGILEWVPDAQITK